MAVPVTYMGTKWQLADDVRSLACGCKKGPFLDVFAGMCSVGSAIASTCSIWSNDAQHFAVLVAKAKFTAKSKPPLASSLPKAAWNLLQNQIAGKKNFLRSILVQEKHAIEARSVESLNQLFDVGHRLRGRFDLPDQRCGTFVDRYAGTYFGFEQCIEIDSLREMTDCLLEDFLIDEDSHRWLILALAVSASKISTTTGHFAQPLRPKASNIIKYSSQRKRSALAEWSNALFNLAPLGTWSWRKKT